MNPEPLAQKISAWAAKFDGLNLRERLLSLLMTMTVLWGGVDMLLLDPALQRKALARQSLNTSETQAAALQTQLVALAGQRPQDPNAALREKGEQLRVRIGEADAALHEFGQGLVSPADMSELLERLLADAAGPRLEAFRKLPAADVLGLKAQPNAAGTELSPPLAENPVYRHGVELTLTGSYTDLLSYLDAVEHMPWKVLWGEVDLTTIQHPRLRLRLTLYTLSLERDWLVL